MKPYRSKPASGQPPHVIAHRGISGKAPENSLAALSLALAKPGIDMVELDVRISSDEQIIVLHDRTLQRTTTGNGAARDYTLAELKTLDAGSWFHPSFSGERIPTLREVLEKARNKTWLNIELKGDLFFRASDAFVRKVVETVQECGMADAVLYSSFTHDLLARIHRFDSRAHLGVIYNIYRDFGRSPSKLASRVGATVFVCAKHELRKSMVKDARQAGVALYVYTLNVPEDVRRMLEIGIDGIISDNADDIVSLVKSGM